MENTNLEMTKAENSGKEIVLAAASEVQPVPAEKTATGNIIFLKEARAAVSELEAMKAAQADLELNEKKQAKSLAAQKKAVEDQVNTTVKKRRDELVRRYDSEISKVQDAIKKIKTKREKSKQQSMKERIAAQQSPYLAENKEMNDKIKALFKQNQVPGFCNSLLYYSLYFPRTMKEVLLMLAIFVICCIAVPCGVFALLPEKKTLWLILIYLVIIVVFGGIYIVIGNMTKDKHLAILQEAGLIRRQMAKNVKKMNSIKRSIKREKTEEHYDLSSFDAELAEKEKEKADLQKKKDEAVAHFENTVKPAITEEIVAGSRDKIRQMEEEHAKTVTTIAQKAEQIKQETFRVGRDYEANIGKEFMQAEKLTALLNFLEGGQAATIIEAENLYREQTAARK